MPSVDDVPDWVFRNLRATVTAHTRGAVGRALREVAQELEADGVDPDVVDRIRAKAARIDGIHVRRDGSVAVQATEQARSTS